MGCISSMIRPGEGRIVNEKMMVMICYTRSMNGLISTFSHGPSKRIEYVNNTAYLYTKQDSQNGVWPPRAVRTAL
jgi:hypothetical protein